MQKSHFSQIKQQTPLVCGNTQELSIPISVKNGFDEEIIIMKNLLKKILLTRALSSWEFFLKHWIEFSLHLLCLIDILQPPLPSSCKCIIASEKIYFHQTAFKLIFDCEEIGLVAFLQFFPLERQQWGYNETLFISLINHLVTKQERGRSGNTQPS